MPQNLLNVARTLNSHAQTVQPPGQEAYLRRAVSTAYYAVFHLLADAAASQFSATHAAHLRRGLDHGPMKNACKSFYPTQQQQARPAGAPGTTYTLSPPNLGTHTVPWELSIIAWNFVQLQAARHNADYNYTQPVTPAQTATAVTEAEEAFTLWPPLAPTPIARVFLGAVTTWATLNKR